LCPGFPHSNKSYIPCLLWITIIELDICHYLRDAKIANSLLYNLSSLQINKKVSPGFHHSKTNYIPWFIWITITGLDISICIRGSKIKKIIWITMIGLDICHYLLCYTVRSNLVPLSFLPISYTDKDIKFQIRCPIIKFYNSNI
jgi:hypothetical protein